LIETITRKYPDVVLPKAGDICYATTNRQKAIKELAGVSDIVLVVGSKNSSNSSKLRHVAEDMGKKAFLIDGPLEIDLSWFHDVRSVGVTAGASGPEELVEDVVKKLEEYGGKFERELRVIEEKMEFPYRLTLQS
jgi:4-hydroxy-3-methylbut-2-en-1-yl diphosphate reductase